MPKQVMTWVGGATLALLIPAAFLTGFYRQQQKAVRRFQFWAVSGPDCPAAPAPRAPPRLRTVEVDGVWFSRRDGHVSCTTLNARGGRSLRSYPVCQFTSPGIVQVATAKGAASFAPGPGRPAFAFFAEGRAHCVVAANPAAFSGDSYRF
jgi:hypothetical protein